MSENNMSEKNNPKVSVVVTTLQRPLLLKRAVRSVLEQTYEALEVLVVEDGSDSGIEEWVESLPNAKYLRHRENMGLPAARNTGLSLAEGKYVAFLDDDDEWLPEKIKEQVALAESKPEADVVYCGNKIVNEKGKLIKEGRPRIKGDIRSEIVRKGLSTVPSSCLFVKESLQRIGGFDQDLKSHIDYDIWMKMAKNSYKADFVPKPLVISYCGSREKMTLDIDSRIEATESYLRKWKPEIEKWTDEAERICGEFYIKVLGRLGIEALKQKRIHSAFICWSRAFWYNPLMFFKKILSYLFI